MKRAGWTGFLASRSSARGIKPSPYFSGKYATDPIRCVRGSRISARASGSAFWPTTAQCAPRPASSKARMAPRALADRSPRRPGIHVDSDRRRCLRTTSNAVLNWPSESMVSTGVWSRKWSAFLGPGDNDITSEELRPRTTREAAPKSFAVPVLFRPTPEVAAGHHTRFIVIRSRIGFAGCGMNRDERQADFHVLGGDRRSGSLVCLELDHQIDILVNQLIGAPERRLCGSYRLSATINSTLASSATSVRLASTSRLNQQS